MFRSAALLELGDQSRGVAITLDLSQIPVEMTPSTLRSICRMTVVKAQIQLAEE